eukprot:8416960-Alexandrium_andersonii.AAC.1
MTAALAPRPRTAGPLSPQWVAVCGRSYALLDLEAQPQGFRLWKCKARGVMLGKCPEVGAVLVGGKDAGVDPRARAPGRGACISPRGSNSSN